MDPLPRQVEYSVHTQSHTRTHTDTHICRHTKRNTHTHTHTGWYTYSAVPQSYAKLVTVKGILEHTALTPCWKAHQKGMSLILHGLELISWTQLLKPLGHAHMRSFIFTFALVAFKLLERIKSHKQRCLGIEQLHIFHQYVHTGIFECFSIFITNLLRGLIYFTFFPCCVVLECRRFKLWCTYNCISIIWHGGDNTSLTTNQLDVMIIFDWSQFQASASCFKRCSVINVNQH